MAKLREANKLFKEKLQQEKRVAREEAKKVREQEKAKKAAQCEAKKSCKGRRNSSKIIPTG